MESISLTEEINELLELNVELPLDEIERNILIDQMQPKICATRMRIENVMNQLREQFNKLGHQSHDLAKNCFKYEDDKSKEFTKELISLTNLLKTETEVYEEIPPLYASGYYGNEYPCHNAEDSHYECDQIAKKGLKLKNFGYILLCQCCYDNNKHDIIEDCPIEYVLYRNPNYFPRGHTTMKQK